MGDMMKLLALRIARVLQQRARSTNGSLQSIRTKTRKREHTELLAQCFTRGRYLEMPVSDSGWPRAGECVEQRHAAAINQYLGGRNALQLLTQAQR